MSFIGKTNYLPSTHKVFKNILWVFIFLQEDSSLLGVKKMITDLDQMNLEIMTDKNQLIPTIRAQFVLEPELDNILKSCSDYKVALEAVAKIALYKRADPSMMIGLIWRKSKENLNLCLRVLDELVDKDLIIYDDSLNIFITKFTLPEDIKGKCDMYGYPLPMLVEPVKVNRNNEDGYLMNSSHNIMLNSSTLNDVCLEHINRVNSIKLTINERVLNNTQNHWTKESGVNQRNFDRFNKYMKSTCEFLIGNGNEFYLTHKYDYRGRCYDVGYYVNNQGTDYQKGILELAEKELINE